MERDSTVSPAARLAAAGRSLGHALAWTLEGGAICAAASAALLQIGGGIGRLCTGRGPGRLLEGLFTAAAPAAMLGGQLASALQTLLGLETPGRRLARWEEAELRKVFGDALDCDRVRVKERRLGLLGLGPAFVLGNSVFLPRGVTRPGLLVHEAAHLWQFQQGGLTYISSSLYHQAFGDGYDLEKGLRQGKRFAELNAEQQATLVEWAYEQGCFDRPTLGRFVVAGVDHTAYLREAMEQIWRGQGTP